ncbi:MAG: ABC transporter ATP-binding protein [Alphaproteobacteria bacterium]|nr:ABC transporter ATP-binding protein [Alphaproteobacteria bacterium]
MLVVEGVTQIYRGGVTALNNVSIEIKPGLFGLLGPNGAGKSTLMRTIATLQAPSNGTIRFGDIDVIKDPDRLRQVLGYLPQDFGVYPRVSAYAMLDHMAVLKGIADSKQRRQTVETLLRQTNLWAVRNKSIAGFSGGMRQRYGIAQALIGKPQLLIVDEPTAGLDPEERNRFLNLLADVSQTVVVILSTHIVDDVAQLCSDMAIISKGRIVRQGIPSALTAELKGKVWRSFIAKTELEAAKAAHNVILSRLVGGRTLIHVLSDANPGVGFEAVTPDLEDVYFAALTSAQTN